ncbi:MAG: hypothetical protein M3Q48_07815 [Actinomycetota bacterium]|nr:hypothetical protein [Actinomycetota bacterium]
MDRLSGDEAALVFRRAAELEAARQAASRDDALELEAVEAAGREVGLSPTAVREAVAELRARGVPGTPGAAVGLTDADAARTVHGPRRSVERSVVDFLEGEVLVRERDLGDRTVWVREPGLEAAIERRIEAVDLRPVRRLVAAVVPVPGERRTHVRFEVEVAGPSTSLRAGVPLAAASAGAAAAAFVEPVAAGGVAAVGLVLAGLGWRSARAARRRAAGHVKQALERFLDWLERR